MVRQQDWYDPVVMKRMRRYVTITLWVVIALIITLQYNWLIPIIKSFF